MTEQIIPWQPSYVSKTWLHGEACQRVPGRWDALSTRWAVAQPPAVSVGAASIAFAWFASLRAVGRAEAGVVFRVPAPALHPSSCRAPVPQGPGGSAPVTAGGKNVLGCSDILKKY